MSNKTFIGLVATFITVIVVLIGSFIFIEKVPEGKVAVIYSPSKGASGTINPGWEMIGFFEDTQQYPTRPIITKTNISVTTNDGKKITMPVSYQMKVEKSKVLDIFKELGSQDIEQIQEGYLYQKLFKASRSVVSEYSVLDIYGVKTTEASAKISEQMAASTEKLGFIITDVTLGTPEVDSATQKAIDSRVQAAQTLEKLNLDKKIATSNAEKIKIEAQGVADAAIEKARGEAESVLVKAEAQAKANKLMNVSLTDNVLKKMELDARAKHGWITIQGATPLVNTK